MESQRDFQRDVVSAKGGNLGLQQHEPELAKLGENDTLLIDTLAAPYNTQSSCQAAVQKEDRESAYVLHHHVVS